MNKEELDEILKAHSEWLNSEGEKGEVADLRGANLSGANFSRANLSDARMRDVDLSDADLGGAELRYAKTEGRNLKEVTNE